MHSVRAGDRRYNGNGAGRYTKIAGHPTYRLAAYGEASGATCPQRCHCVLCCRPLRVVGLQGMWRPCPALQSLRYGMQRQLPIASRPGEGCAGWGQRLSAKTLSSSASPSAPPHLHPVTSPSTFPLRELVLCDSLSCLSIVTLQAVTQHSLC